MILLPWWPSWGEGAVLYGGAVLAWSLALYVLTRGGWGRVPILTATAVLVLLVYLLGQAFGALSSTQADWIGWLRRTWWGAALAPAVWVLLTWAVLLDEVPGWPAERRRALFWPVATGAVTLALAFGFVGTATELVNRWSQVTTIAQPLALEPGPVRHTPTGPFFPIYALYVLVGLIWGGANAVVLWRSAPSGTPLRARFRWLVLAAVLFLLSGMYVVLASGYLGLSSLPAEIALLVGLGLMSLSIARYGALLAGEAVTADFLSFALALALVVLGYGLILLLALPSASRPGEMLLLLALMTTHVLASRRSALLDRVIFGRLPGRLQTELLALADRVARQPDIVTALVDVREGVAELVEAEMTQIPASSSAAGSVEAASVPEPGSGAADGELRLLVEGALRRLADLPALSRHPLTDLLQPPNAPNASPLERANAARALIEQAIERLRPSGPRPTPGSAGPGGWLHYVVLHEAYVDGRPNKQVMARWYLSEGTFNRARRRAIDAVADDLRARLRPATAPRDSGDLAPA